MVFLIAAAALAALILPPMLIRRSRDRLAAEILARPDGKPALLTPADRCLGRFRRVPGVLGLDAAAIRFESRIEAPTVLPLDRIRKISSGVRMASGRRLIRSEVLTLVDRDGTSLEFLMPRASVYQWRRHLGEWAARKKSEEQSR